MIKFFTGTLEQIETEYNAFEKTVSVSNADLTLKPSGTGVLTVRYTEKPETSKTLNTQNTRTFPAPEPGGYFAAKKVQKFLQDIETEVRGYVKDIKAGKTLNGFDRDSETYFQCYRVKDNTYAFGTLTEGVNCDYDTQEFIAGTDDDLCYFILENCGLYPEFRIE